MELFGGKWNSRIICVLAALGTLRYSELRREMGNITDAVLATTLNRGIIERLPEINQMTVKYMKQASSESSKTRRITLISAPTNEQVMVMEKQGQWLSRPYCLEGILNPARENAMKKR